MGLTTQALFGVATAHGLSGDHVELSQTVPVRAAIHATIEEVNATLNHLETIKRFTMTCAATIN